MCNKNLCSTNLYDWHWTYIIHKQNSCTKMLLCASLCPLINIMHTVDENCQPPQELKHDSTSEEDKKENEQERQGHKSKEENQSGSEHVIPPQAPNLQGTTAAGNNSLIQHIESFNDTNSAIENRLNISMESIISEDDYHHVWRPKKEPHLPDLVISTKELQERQRKSMAECSTRPLLERSVSRMSLHFRQQQLMDRVQATQAVLKESPDEILGSSDSTTKKSGISFKEASRRIISSRRKQNNRLSDVVTQYLTKVERERGAYAALPRDPRTPTSSAGFPALHAKRELYKRCSTHGVLGAIRLDEWQRLQSDEIENCHSEL